MSWRIDLAAVVNGTRTAGSVACVHSSTTTLQNGISARTGSPAPTHVATTTSALRRIF
eukprot:CAMPEP_0185855166 /NCGR_PEP_ID=MMETSP1354-20130828/24847_1 /TAXON_ID=708628 /ORGANISM="Erythrolobus madagascarensis, Strain CCMP3276" /LENGTH=57 /DNA_ID=CAMNT_0028557125 /DNA_START=47 /DNA_END=217 /DNA_ORIENTATION=-